MKKKLLSFCLIIAMGSAEIVKGSDNSTFKIITYDNNKNQKFDPRFVSICFPPHKDTNNCPSFCQVPSHAERTFPALCDLVDEKGKVELDTKISPSLVMTFLDAYACKNIQTMIAVKSDVKNLMQDFDDSICKKLGLPLLSTFPTLHHKAQKKKGETSSLEIALDGQPKENYISFMVGRETSLPSWKQALAFICLEKLKVESIIDKAKIKNNIVALEFNRKIDDCHKESLLILVGAYINTYAEKNSVTKIQTLQQICNQVPAVIKTIFKSNIAKILGLVEKDVIGFETNAIDANLKAAHTWTAKPAQWMGYAAGVALLFYTASWLKAKAGF